MDCPASDQAANLKHIGTQLECLPHAGTYSAKVSGRVSRILLHLGPIKTAVALNHQTSLRELANIEKRLDGHKALAPLFRLISCILGPDSVLAKRGKGSISKASLFNLASRYVNVRSHLRAQRGRGD